MRKVYECPETGCVSFCLFHHQLQTVQLDDILSADLEDRQHQNRYQKKSVLGLHELAVGFTQYFELQLNANSAKINEDELAWAIGKVPIRHSQKN